MQLTLKLLVALFQLCMGRLFPNQVIHRLPLLKGAGDAGKPGGSDPRGSIRRGSVAGNLENVPLGTDVCGGLAFAALGEVVRVLHRSQDE